MINTPRKYSIGRAFYNIREQVVETVSDLIRQYREFSTSHPDQSIELIKQAIDTPARYRAGVLNWIQKYNQKNGNGSAQALLTECLNVYGAGKPSPVTLAEIDAEITNLEVAAQALVVRRSQGESWDSLADAIEQFIEKDSTELSLSRLEIPANYITIWGDQY